MAKLKRPPVPEPPAEDEELSKVTLWWEPKPLPGEPDRVVMMAIVDHPTAGRATFTAPPSSAAHFNTVIRKAVSDGVVLEE